MNPDQKGLTVDATRNRIQQMRSFNAGEFPPIRSSSQTSYQSREPDRGPRFYSQDRYDEFRSGGQNRDRYSSNLDTRSRSYQPQSPESEGDWYYYQWYVIPNERESSANQSNYRDSGNRSGQRNADDWNSDSRSSQNRQAARDTYTDRNRDSRSSGSNAQFRGRPSSETGWTAYDRYYRQQQDSENSEMRSNQSGRRQNYQDTTGQGSSQSAQSSRSSSSDDRSEQTAPANSQRLSGWIRDINRETQMLTVEGENKTLKFRVEDNAAIKVNGQQDASFDQLSRGQQVDVGYAYRNGANRAFTINQHPQQPRSRSSQQGTENEFED